MDSFLLSNLFNCHGMGKLTGSLDDLNQDDLAISPLLHYIASLPDGV